MGLFRQERICMITPEANFTIDYRTLIDSFLSAYCLGRVYNVATTSQEYRYEKQEREF